MNNLLQFPVSTIVDKLIPKAQFVKASSTPTAIRTLLADEFEQIRLLYVLRPDTVNVADGNEVKEIDVFYFRCKTEYYSINPFYGLDDLIPRHTIYIIEHGNNFLYNLLANAQIIANQFIYFIIHLFFAVKSYYCDFRLYPYACRYSHLANAGVDIKILFLLVCIQSAPS